MQGRVSESTAGTIRSSVLVAGYFTIQADLKSINSDVVDSCITAGYEIILVRIVAGPRCDGFGLR